MSVRGRIVSKLVDALKPAHLEVINESHQHSVPKNSETHFRIVVVSEEFDNKSRIEQHRTIYSLLSDEMSSGVHALALQTIPANKWTKPEPPQPAESPKCVGGMKREMSQNEKE